MPCHDESDGENRTAKIRSVTDSMHTLTSRHACKRCVGALQGPQRRHPRTQRHARATTQALEEATLGVMMRRCALHGAYMQGPLSVTCLPGSARRAPGERAPPQPREGDAGGQQAHCALPPRGPGSLNSALARHTSPSSTDPPSWDPFLWRGGGDGSASRLDPSCTHAPPAPQALARANPYQATCVATRARAGKRDRPASEAWRTVESVEPSQCTSWTVAT